jgi:protein-export SecD/SecF family membrane protein
VRKNLLNFIIVLVISALAFIVVLPKGPNIFSKETKIHLGLDLQGGVQLFYKIDMSKNDRDPIQVQNETIDLIRRRVDNLGVSEPTVQATRIGQDYGVLVELPGINDIEQAKQMIGKTAQLKFYELDASGGQQETNLTGSDVVKAQAGTDSQQTGFSAVAPIISLEFSEEGAKKFKDITKRNIGKPIITKLDDEVVNMATVQAEIDGGKAQIEGIKTLNEAKKTAQMINEGALPAPIGLVQESHIGATLGRDAIEKSLIAGIIGILLVGIFMIIYYGGLGVVAVAALAIYTLIVIAIFKLMSVTMTLSGIAGFIFSIGAAVDANILVFERFKEEKHKNQTIVQALENGFSRSWPSIRDSNIASLITAAILFYMSTGIVRGFAVTLAIGIFVSLFTAIFVTRTILRFFIKNKAE